MKYINLIITSTIVLLFAACGNNNSIEAKKTALDKLKKQALDINAQIATLEKDLAKAGAGEVAKASLVVLDSVQVANFTHYIELQGKVESESVSNVTPKAGGGQVKAVLVKRGDLVRKGQLLLQLDNTLIKQQVAAATQNLEVVKAQASLAKSVYEKQKNLWEQNIGSEIQLLTAKTNAEATASQWNAVSEQVKMAKEQLGFMNIYSDVDGEAEEVNVKVGEIFMGQGQIKIVNTNHLKLTTNIPENYIGKVKVGTEMNLFFPDINKSVAAKLSVVGKVIDPLSRSFFVETKLAADKNLRPNQLAQVKIKDYEKKNAISIPINIVQTDDKGKFIYIATTENGKLIARKKIITVGEFYGNNIEVLSGISVGEIIIKEGFQSLYDGQFITTSTK